MTLGEKIENLQLLEGRCYVNMFRLATYTLHYRGLVKDMNELHQRFMSVMDPEYRDNKKIFVLLAFYFYDPKLLYGHRRVPKGKIRKEIGRVLGISGSSVTRHFADAKSLFKNHKGFREETERVFAALGVD